MEPVELESAGEGEETVAEGEEGEEAEGGEVIKAEGTEEEGGGGEAIKAEGTEEEGALEIKGNRRATVEEVTRGGGRKEGRSVGKERTLGPEQLTIDDRLRIRGTLGRKTLVVSEVKLMMAAYHVLMVILVVLGFHRLTLIVDTKITTDAQVGVFAVIVRKPDLDSILHIYILLNAGTSRKRLFYFHRVSQFEFRRRAYY
ncbi:hypothetical protein K501DRAFT_270735 [Backusella circina FSU 941]|nr:hypothetical protein K501DRAFT_270735 [Backusella circina FSU 941]